MMEVDQESLMKPQPKCFVHANGILVLRFKGTFAFNRVNREMESLNLGGSYEILKYRGDGLGMGF